jgi:hypothetical protein
VGKILGLSARMALSAYILRPIVSAGARHERRPIECDSLGEISVPAGRLWGAQIQLSPFISASLAPLAAAARRTKELDHSVPSHRLTNWITERIQRLYDTYQRCQTAKRDTMNPPTAHDQPL